MALYGNVNIYVILKIPMEHLYSIRMCSYQKDNGRCLILQTYFAKPESCRYG